MSKVRVEEYHDEYKDWLDGLEEQGEFAHGTVRQRKYAVNEFVSYFQYHEEVIDLEDFYGTIDTIKQFFEQTPTTQAKVSGVRKFLEYIVRQLPTEQAERLDDVRDRVKLSKLEGSAGHGRSRKNEIEDKILTEEEIDTVLAVAKPYEYVVVKCMLDTGCRPGELAALTLDDFQFDVDQDGIGATVKIEKTYSQGVGVQDHPKTDDSIRTVNLRPDTADALRQFAQERGLETDELIFGSYRMVYDAIKEVFTFAQIRIAGDGVTAFSPHWLRHNTCTRLIREGYPKEKVQQYMGHSSVTITEIYEHFNEDEVLDIYA